MPNTSRYEPYDLLLEEDLCVFWDHGGKGRMVHVQRDTEPMNPRTEWDNVAVMACFHSRHSLGDKIDAGDPGEFWDGLVRKHVDNKALYAMMQSGKIPAFLNELEESGVPLADRNGALELFHAWVEDGGEGIRAAMDVLKDSIEFRPMWLYEHSGMTVSCGERAYPYNDRFDSSAIGWCVVEKQKALSELGATEKDWRRKAAGCIEDEVRSYDQYLQGEVWWYETKSCDGCCSMAECGMAAPSGHVSGEGAWDEGDSCGGFFGDRLVTSGMADSVGDGLLDALKSGKYWTGKARSQTVTVWSYVREGDDG